MLQRIMVALDGSPLAEQTLPYASALARAFEAEVILLRVVEAPSGTPGRALDDFDWRMERTESIAYLEEVKRRLETEDVSVDVDVTAGRACEEILEMARARQVDLIVLGSHGAGGLSDFRMASNAQKVVLAADTSVLVVPAHEVVANEHPFETVLAPVDCTPRSDWAVTLAARLASTQGAELVVLHVVRAPALLEPRGTARERELVEEIVTLNRGAAGRYMESLVQRLEPSHLKMRTVVDVADHVAPVLERLASAEPRPLLVLNERTNSGFDAGFHGSLVAVLLAGSKYPVLVLREPARRHRGRWSKAAASLNRGRAPLRAE